LVDGSTLSVLGMIYRNGTNFTEIVKDSSLLGDFSLRMIWTCKEALVTNLSCLWG